MPTVIKVRCPACKTLLRLPNDSLGKPIRCNHCDRRFRAALKGKPTGANGPSAPPPAVTVPETALDPPADPWPAEVPPDLAADPANLFDFDFDGRGGGEFELTAFGPTRRYRSTAASARRWAAASAPAACWQWLPLSRQSISSPTQSRRTTPPPPIRHRSTKQQR